jgi:hypothetical protein
MTVYHLLKNQAFEPEAIATMTSAYTDQDHPQTNAIAKKVIEFAQLGERDPIRLRQFVIEALER